MPLRMVLLPMDSQLRAIVSGATSGIGAAFARLLASEGHDLLMIGRRKDKIEALARELASTYGVSARVLIADLSREDGMSTVLGEIETFGPADVLINSAGFGLGATVDTPEHHQGQRDMIQVHVCVAVRIIQTALPQMVLRKSGTIINVSSLASFFPLPGGGTYSATKAFLNSYSEALHMEVAPHGVRVQALCPGFVRTDFHDRMGISDRDIERRNLLGWMQAEVVARLSLRKARRGPVVYIPGLLNKLVVRLGTKIPKRLYYSLVTRLLTPTRK